MQNALNHQPDINDTNDLHCGWFYAPIPRPPEWHRTGNPTTVASRMVAIRRAMLAKTW